MRDNARATSSTVDSGKGHGTRLSSRLRLKTKVDTVFSDGPSIVGWRFPG